MPTKRIVKEEYICDVCGYIFEEEGEALEHEIRCIEKEIAIKEFVSTIKENDIIENKDISGYIPNDEMLGGKQFINCKFYGCDFSNKNLNKTIFTNCIVDRCDFSYSEMHECRFDNSEIVSCDFFGATGTNVGMINSRLEYILPARIFDTANLDNTSFKTVRHLLGNEDITDCSSLGGYDSERSERWVTITDTKWLTSESARKWYDRGRNPHFCINGQ